MTRSRPKKQHPGSSSKKIAKSKRQEYPAEALTNALKECEANSEKADEAKLSLRQIAALHGLPLSTLHRHLSGITKSTTIGRKPVLGIEVENTIAKNVLAWHDRGLSLRISQLKLFTFDVAKDLHPDAPITKAWARTGVTAKWVHGFMKRHPMISKRISDNLDHHRRNVTVEHVKGFFRLLKEVTDEHGPFTADRIFNLDETNMQPSGRQESVLCRRGSWHAHTAGNANRDSVTLLPCISAAGKLLPPLVICKGKHLGTPRFLKNLKLEGTTWERARFVTQESAYMTSDIFTMYMRDLLLPETAELRSNGKGILLLLDNFGAHLDPRVLQMAVDNGIHMLAFPPHSTHLLQPLDVGIMQPLKHLYTQAFSRWQMADPLNSTKVVSTQMSLEILCLPQSSPTSAWDAANNANNIKSAFFKSGIFPIDFDMVAPKLTHQNLTAVGEDLDRQAEVVASQDQAAEQRHLEQSRQEADAAGPDTPPNRPETLPRLHHQEELHGHPDPPADAPQPEPAAEAPAAIPEQPAQAEPELPVATQLARVDKRMEPPPARRAVHSRLQMPEARLLTSPDFREDLAAKLTAKDMELEEKEKRKAEREQKKAEKDLHMQHKRAEQEAKRQRKAQEHELKRAEQEAKRQRRAEQQEAARQAKANKPQKQNSRQKAQRGKDGAAPASNRPSDVGVQVGKEAAASAVDASAPQACEIAGNSGPGTVAAGTGGTCTNSKTTTPSQKQPQQASTGRQRRAPAHLAGYTMQ
ncbi:probable Jerky protein homolog-like at N-terminal half [Coccomyxa sp. Obi]|nr:probable Jerky protein homolog-like at N-terminal half [Coccomyxa sp. Obi]